MTTLQFRSRLTVAALGRDLSEFLSKTLGECSESMTQTRAQIAQIDELKLRDGVKERSIALSPTQQRESKHQQHYDACKKEGYGLGWVLSPFDTHAALSQLNNAKNEHEDIVRAYDEPDTKVLRDSQILAHNLHVTEQREKQTELKVKMHKLTQVHIALSGFANDAAHALHAACGQGWLAADFGEHLERANKLIRQGNVHLASKYLAHLIFQKRPDDTVYERLHRQALDLRKRAYSVHYGVSVTGSFPAIVEACAKLAAANLKAVYADQLLSGLHTADQWQLLTRLAASPEVFSNDVLWSIYWAMFQCQQQMADVLDSVVSMEDPLNGRFSQCVEHWLTDWASKYIPLFGYPMSQSYLGMLQLANTPEETHVGADLGVIISLNIGGLVCRKAVLLQAKRAKDWEANIGSQKGQLPKLSRLPRGGYYLFYHESPELRFDSPVPTVSSAKALHQLIIESKRDPSAPSLNLDVRTSGWDWASFISFGLCDPASGIGETFDTVDDAMRVLGSGEIGGLPLRLYLLAIEDEPFTLELKQRLRHQYRRPDLDRSMGKTSKKDLGREGFDLEM
ncbi:hypothetical protein [Pseudomonas sp. WS 5146]|uniref:hypothetical protein n=1 Tax=Pseudomonas TaxID=286 RepID=UPI0014728804|nr:hypothetical protein [Pseudomonas sp. WS 5146]NMX56116.1 hypothetical protein [Pseudomonas sp. WS 5146]